VPGPPRAWTPIVPFSAALIAGAAYGGARPAPGVASVAAIALVALAVLLRRRPILGFVLIAAASGAAGLTVAGLSWRQAGDRVHAAFGEERTMELALEARIVAAAERDRDGRRQLAVEFAAGAAAGLRVRLEVADLPADDAPRVDALRRGDLVRVWCRLSRPGPAPGLSAAAATRRLASQGFDATARVKSSRLIQTLATGAWSPGRAVDGTRVAARARLDRAVGANGDARAVLGAMLLGDRLLLDDDVNVLLRDAGLVHILSISGLHTALSVMLLLALFRRTGMGSRGMLFAGCASLVLFSAFVGHGASVWRACASIGAGLAARALYRDVEPMTALALAAGTLVAAVPSLAWNAGFLLSVVATAGLLAACPAPVPGHRRPSALARSMAASAGAYLATVPLLAGIFGRLAPVALMANLAAAPLCAACLATGAAATAASALPVAGPLTALAAASSVAGLLQVSHWAASVPGGHLRVPPPPAFLVVVYVASILGLWLAGHRLSARVRRAIGLIAAIALIAFHLGPPPAGAAPAGVTILDVGQGLAAVLRGADGRFVLVDAGPTAGGRFDAGDRIVVPALVAAGCRRVEVLALSHDHDDHAGGARAVLRDLDVGELWIASGAARDPLTRRVIAQAVASGVAVRALKRGDASDRAGFSLLALHPGPGDRRRPVNDRCLVLRARVPGGPSLLLPGDLEAPGEEALLAAGLDPAADAMVAPHHGADGSSTARFLAQVAPRVVLVSAGERNRFGHPGARALERFAAVDARVLRTDRDGTLALTAGQGSWRLSVEDEGRRDEGDDEDECEDDRERDATGP